jgi:predicted  nucleic acid-binding Zn-ribbon protein
MADQPIRNRGAETIRLSDRRARIAPGPEEPLPNPLEVVAVERVATRPRAAAFPAATPDHAGPDDASRRSGRLVNVLLSGPLIGALWLAACAAYFQQVYGWEALSLLMPHEIGGFVIGSVTPLALIWLFTSYRRRGIEQQRALRAVERALDGLGHPSATADARIRTVSDALQRQSRILSDASEEVAGRLLRIEGNFRQHYGDLGEAAEHAAAQARFVQEILQQQSDRLSTVAERVAQQSRHISEALAHQTGDLNHAVDRAANRAREVGEVLAAQCAALDASADGAADRAAQLQDLWDRFNHGLEGSSARASRAAADTGRAMERQSQDLRGAAELMTTLAAETGETLQQRLDALSASSDHASERIRKAGDAIHDHASDLAAVTVQAAYRAEEAARTLQWHTVALGQSVDGVDDRIVAAADAMQHRAQEVTQASDTALARMHDVDQGLAHLHGLGTQLSDEVERLDQTTGRVADNMARAGEACFGHTDQLLTTYRQADGENQRLKAELGETVRQLTAAFDHLTDRAGTLQGTCRAYTEELSTAADWAERRQRALAETLGQEAGGREWLAEGVATRAEAMREAFQREAADLDAAADHAAARVDSMAESIRRQTATLADSVDQAVARLNAVDAGMVHRASELNEAVERAEAALGATGEAVAGRLRELNDASGEAEARLGRIAETLQRQAAAVRATAAAATPPVAGPDDDTQPEPGEPIDEAERGAFLRSATFVVDNLNSIAVDLNRLLEHNIPQSVWRAFYAGDKGAFTRRILMLHHQRDLRLIGRKFQHDAEFRADVSRYLGAFENLIEQAGSWDRDNLLHTTFLTADIGKLYLLLSQAVGRYR